MSRRKSKTILGERIRKARLGMGMSQKDLAQKLLLSDKTVSAYEVGRTLPSFPTLRKISRIVHQPITYFDEEMAVEDLDLQIKIKTIEKELLEIKKLLKKKKINKNSSG